MDGRDSSEDRDRVRNAALTLQVSGNYDLEYRIVRPDGSIRLIHDHAFPIKNAQGQIYRVAGLAADVTREDSLKINFGKHKNGSHRAPCRSIAHDFNNILTVMQIQTSLLASQSELGPTVKNGMEEIMAAVERAANLTRQLLTFSRRKVKLTKDLDASEILAV